MYWQIVHFFDTLEAIVTAFLLRGDLADSVTFTWSAAEYFFQSSSLNNRCVCSTQITICALKSVNLAAIELRKHIDKWTDQAVVCPRSTASQYRLCSYPSYAGRLCLSGHIRRGLYRGETAHEWLMCFTLSRAM